MITEERPTGAGDPPCRASAGPISFLMLFDFLLPHSNLSMLRQPSRKPGKKATPTFRGTTISSFHFPSTSMENSPGPSPLLTAHLAVVLANYVSFLHPLQRDKAGEVPHLPCSRPTPVRDIDCCPHKLLRHYARAIYCGSTTPSGSLG